MIDDEMNAQLIDLGFCYKCDSSFNNSDSEIIGSPAYMAPELLATLNCVQSESADGKACDQATDKLEKYKSGDVYALGITLFTMVVGIPPFAQASKFDPNYRAFLLSNKRPGSLHFWKKHPKAKDMLAKSEISKEFIELFEGM